MEPERHYAISLMLIGVALAADGDRKRVIEQLVPELLEGYGPERALRAVQNRDRESLEIFLAQIGVHMIGSEKAVDAIIRAHLEHARTRAKQQYDEIERAVKNEEALAMARESEAQK